MSQTTSSPIRQHDGSGPVLHLFEAACVITAIGLILVHACRLWHHEAAWNWLTPILILLACPAADFVSGLVHWLADTWGQESLPVIGPRFLRPFRVHHVTPMSFLKCGFFDTNGDTALIGLPILLSVFALPLDELWGCLFAEFIVAFCAWALPTNQIHQWAHMPEPPRWVAGLQRWGLILSPSMHLRHHLHPHTGHYCITTGWCNRWLDSIGFFRRLEQLVVRVTGFQPRADEDSR